MCYVHLVLEEVYQLTAELVAKDLAMNTSRELPQYFIQRWQLTYMAQSLYLKLSITFIRSILLENIRQGLKMEIVFRRRLTNELLTTYLPSLQVADEIEIFSGASNKLTVGQTYSKQFHCTYLLHYFPFDSQVHYFFLISICVGTFFQLMLLIWALSNWFNMIEGT